MPDADKAQRRPALRRFADANAERLRGRSEDPAVWEAMREAIADHLADYLDGKAPAMDKEIALALRSALQQASATEVPDLFRPRTRQRGESPDTMGARECKRTAVEYLAFCKAHGGRFDRGAVSTVARAFGVDRRTVQRWHEAAPDARPLNGWQLEPEEQFEQVRAALDQAAALFPSFGGATGSAIRTRNAKRDT